MENVLIAQPPLSRLTTSVTRTSRTVKYAEGKSHGVVQAYITRTVVVRVVRTVTTKTN